MINNSFASYQYQVVESVAVHEETTANDITDYTDWSTYEGESWYLFFCSRCEYL